jgi:hypothetical protein
MRRQSLPVIDRRTFVLAFGAGILGVRFPAIAQSTPRLPRIGYLAFNTAVIGAEYSRPSAKHCGNWGGLTGTTSSSKHDLPMARWSGCPRWSESF